MGSEMSGKRNGVAKQLMDEEPRAVFMHCYVHALNLAVGDTTVTVVTKQVKIFKDVLDV